jgi:predicted thioesterase
MPAAVTGVVHGSTVTLDEPVPPLEGKRVRVTLEALRSEDVQVSAEEQRRLLREWAERGPQGPLDADDTWPDET